MWYLYICIHIRTVLYKHDCISGNVHWTYRQSVTVPDKRIRNIPEVVVVRRWVRWGSGNLEGEGWVKGGTREGRFTSNLRPRWTIPVTARRVPSK
jgi:hypothetical protein